MSNKAIFLDRDDTLIDDPGYLSDPDQVKLLPGVPRALVEFKNMGYKTVVVTNQSAVARGIITEKVLRTIHSRLEELLAKENAFLDGIYYCPYHPDGVVARFRKESECRKPNPGMLLTAADEMDIDLGESWMIGNAPHDVEAGLSAGCKTILIDSPSRQNVPQPGDPTPHYRAVNITEAVNIIKKYHRRRTESPPAPEPPEALQVDAAPAEPALQETETIPEEPEPEAEAPQIVEADPEGVEKATEPTPENPEPHTHDTEPETRPAEPHWPVAKDQADTTEELLRQILDQLRAAQRSSMFNEFSVMRFIAGIVQMVVFLCLLITIWLLMSPNRDQNSVLIALGFAAVLQIMSLTFFIMQDRK